MEIPNVNTVVQQSDSDNFAALMRANWSGARISWTGALKILDLI